MAFHDIFTLGDFGNGGCPGLDLLLFEEVGSKGGTDEDVDLVLRLQTRGHLLVDDFLRNGRGGCIWIFREELFRGFDGKV